ncbi:hypothetical protein MSG28_010546 [Choristoneura fumiferana]|uniref:Uncharacterized protein n=1 Tax=Choristoneura fumiferana TaxID=7141 RepID=A0ACC0KM57_CHOFU|nr:hypothetical protein MSG28_010546 [Choristoneura fumiferana]
MNVFSWATWRKLPGQPAGDGRRRARSGAGAGAEAGAGAGWARAAPRALGARLKDCLLVYGGYKDLRGSTNELWAFHYESESWHQVRTATAGPARHRHAAALHDARLYVHGGQSDLRACGDLCTTTQSVYSTTHYTSITHSSLAPSVTIVSIIAPMSRVWTAVRLGRGRARRGARAGHAGLRAGAHFYIFGGDLDAGAGATNELWRFHFGTAGRGREWGQPWPRGVRGGGPPAPPAGLLRELGRLSALHMRRAARCSYSALGQDSTESLVLPKSHSAYAMERPAEGGPREADEAERRRADISREPISVPDFADMVLPTPVLSAAQAAKLVYLDSDEEEELRREFGGDAIPLRRLQPALPRCPRCPSRPRSASAAPTTTASCPRRTTRARARQPAVGRVAGLLQPALPRAGRARAGRGADAGLGRGRRRAGAPGRPARPALLLLVVGGREPPHVARLQSPISLWTYRLL